MKKKRLFEVTTLVRAYSLKGVIEQGAKFGEVIKVTLEDKPQTIQDNEQNQSMGFKPNKRARKANTNIK